MCNHPIHLFVIVLHLGLDHIALSIVHHAQPITVKMEALVMKLRLVYHLAFVLNALLAHCVKYLLTCAIQTIILASTVEFVNHQCQLRVRILVDAHWASVDRDVKFK